MILSYALLSFIGASSLRLPLDMIAPRVCFLSNGRMVALSELRALEKSSSGAILSAAKWRLSGIPPTHRKKKLLCIYWGYWNRPLLATWITVIPNNVETPNNKILCLKLVRYEKHQNKKNIFLPTVKKQIGYSNDFLLQGDGLKKVSQNCDREREQ